MPADASSEPDKQSLHYIFRSGLAGGVAGCVAKTVVAPLDRVKILFQASNPDYQKYAGSLGGAFRAGAAIYGENGVRGLLQGHSATLLRIFPYAAIKFMAYDQLSHFLMPADKRETKLRPFLAGSLAGIISVVCTYPLELIRVRLAFQTHSLDPLHKVSLTRAIADIYHEGAKPSSQQNTGQTTKYLFQRYPVFSFYRGFSVTLFGMVPYAGTSFLTWEFLRSHLLPLDPVTKRRLSTPYADLGIGAISGMLSQTVSYPFEVIRRRMQVGGLTRPDRWLTFGETVSAIWVKRGVKGFFVGLSLGYIKVVPMTAVSFAVWEAGKKVLRL